jgi:hypothetical protein
MDDDARGLVDDEDAAQRQRGLRGQRKGRGFRHEPD